MGVRQFNSSPSDRLVFAKGQFWWDPESARPPRCHDLESSKAKNSQVSKLYLTGYGYTVNYVCAFRKALKKASAIAPSVHPGITEFTRTKRFSFLLLSILRTQNGTHAPSREKSLFRSLITQRNQGASCQPASIPCSRSRPGNKLPGQNRTGSLRHLLNQYQH